MSDAKVHPMHVTVYSVYIEIGYRTQHGHHRSTAPAWRDGDGGFDEYQPNGREGGIFR